MEFRGWLMTETILIKYLNAENALFFSPDGPAMEFNYQWENGFSNYFIGCYQARRPGYVSISTRPTHLAIIKRSPLEHGQGIDFGFLKNLINLLQQNRLKAIPYKEVGTSFDSLFQKVGYQPEYQPETGFQTGETLPDMELGASNVQKLSPGISASKETGSWAYFIEISEPTYYVPKILEILEQAAQPLVKNNFIDFYEIVDRRSNKRTKVVHSEKGKQESDDWKTKDNKAASQIKYLAATLLSGSPTFKTALLRTIGTDDLKGGGQGWFGHDAQPKNYNLPIEELYALNKRSFSEDIVIKIFLDSLQDPQKLQQLEQLAQWSEKKKQETTGQKYPPYHLGGGAEVLSWFWEKNSILQDCINEPLDNISTSHSILKKADILQQLEPEEFNYWKQQLKEALEEALPNAQHLSSSDISYLNDMAGPLNLHPSIVHSLEQANQQHRDEKARKEKIQQESALKRSFLMPEDSFAYMMLNEGKWKPIDQKFLKYISGGYEVDIGELAQDLVGEEVGWEDAMSKAEEDAQEEVQERPSESYGNDQSEVDADIDYYWDEFIPTMDEIDEDTPEEEAVRIIKEKYLDEFIEWRKKEMQEEEEKNSWKYEPDTESNEFQQKVWEYQREFAEEAAWDEGLVILTYPKNVEIQLHKNHWEKFKPLLKRTIELNRRELNDDEEPYWKASTKISIDFIPEGGFTKPAYTLFQELISEAPSQD